MVTMEEILQVAADNKASDIHITVGLPPIMRVNGSLKHMNYDVIVPAEAERIIARILDEGHKKIFEEMGEVDFSAHIDPIGRYRVNVFRQRGNIAAALRTISTVIPRAEDLGVPAAVVDLYKKKRGLVLVTGPTGSGKSTTLASLIDVINTKRDCHILTLEDPIEYLHEHKLGMVNQREMGADSQNYANSLRAALREDPDVILVGEMRDLETISVAVTAAETGHLVLSTLHTIGAAATIDRIIDVFPPHQQQQMRVQLAMVMQAVISQQLMPTADGRRRVAAFEIMLSNPAIKNLIREGKNHQIESIIQTNKKIGMQTMDDCILELYQKGLVTENVALEFAQDVPALEKRMGRAALNLY